MTRSIVRRSRAKRRPFANLCNWKNLFPFLKSFQEIQETRKQCGANGSFHFVFHIHRSPGTVAIRCTSISRLPRREWEYTRDGILCYVLFGSGPREAAFIKGFVDECMCESLDRIAVCPCARACKLLFVENHPIPSTHLEATRLRDSLPSRGGSSLIITEILMASANGFSRELSSRLENSLHPVSTTLRRVFPHAEEIKPTEMMYRPTENVISSRDFGTRLPFQTLSVECFTPRRRGGTKGSYVQGR